MNTNRSSENAEISTMKVLCSLGLLGIAIGLTAYKVHQADEERKEVFHYEMSRQGPDVSIISLSTGFVYTCRHDTEAGAISQMAARDPECTRGASLSIRPLAMEDVTGEKKLTCGPGCIRVERRLHVPGDKPAFARY